MEDLQKNRPNRPFIRAAAVRLGIDQWGRLYRVFSIYGDGSDRAQMEQRFLTSPWWLFAVLILAGVFSLEVGLRIQWYYGVITSVALVGIMSGIYKRDQLCQVFSIRDDECKRAQMEQQFLSNRLEAEEKHLNESDHNKVADVKECKDQLDQVTEDIRDNKFSLAWSRLHFVEETLLLLYREEKVIAELEIIASRALALPSGRREAVNKVLDRARTLPAKNGLLSDEKVDREFRAHLKTALEAINSERNEIHWYRGVYQAQVYILLTFLTPLLIGFVLLQRMHPWPGSLLSLPFLGQILILGAIGGIVSVLHTERSLGEGVTSFYYGTVGLSIRPIIGAVGAMVIYFLFESKLLFDVTNNDTRSASGAIKLAVNPYYFYYILAFLSGFSEQFFTKTVAQLEGRLNGQQKT